MKALSADDPRVIGEYRLRARLGAGGMGRVYLGLSPGGRAVAIKVVHPDLANDGEFLRRFGQEVAAARAVSGIYTAPVVASGLNEQPPWLATAFVPGPALDQVIGENGPLPEQALWPLLAGLVEALQAIHACGVVHRDLKPANVLVATDGPRVIDFGISRAADGTALTAAGVVFGTPGLHVPGAGRGPRRGACERRVRTRLRDCLRGHGDRAVRFGDGRGRLVPGRAQRARPGRDTAPDTGDRGRLPDQGPGRPADAARAVRNHRERAGHDRAVRGVVLAGPGGQPDRRLPGPAGAGDAGGGRPAATALLARRPARPRARSDRPRTRPGPAPSGRRGNNRPQQPCGRAPGSPAPRWPLFGSAGVLRSAGISGQQGYSGQQGPASQGYPQPQGNSGGSPGAATAARATCRRAEGLPPVRDRRPGRGQWPATPSRTRLPGERRPDRCRPA